MLLKVRNVLKLASLKHVPPATKPYNRLSPLQMMSRPLGQPLPQKGHMGVVITGTKAGGGAHITRGNRLASGKTGTSGRGTRDTPQEAGTITEEAIEEEGGEEEEEEMAAAVISTAGVALTEVAHETRTSGGWRAERRGRCSDKGPGEEHTQRTVFLPAFI